MTNTTNTRNAGMEHQRLMRPIWWMLLVVVMLAVALLTGCRATGGKGYSYHRVETYQVTPAGKPYLASRETWKDKNALASAGVLASAQATALTYARSNHLGTTATMGLGKYSDKPEAEAIKATGEAAGKVIGEAVKKAVGP